MPQKVFVDSDVVISSLISSTGAAYLLLFRASENQRTTGYARGNLSKRKGIASYKVGPEFYISNISKKEIEKVISRLNLQKSDFDLLIKSNLNIVKLKHNSLQLKREFNNYTNDPNDTHIIAGAKAAGAKFLISYNIKDFKMEKIHKDFDITLLTPAQFLQYLRSQTAQRPGLRSRRASSKRPGLK